MHTNQLKLTWKLLQITTIKLNWFKGWQVDPINANVVLQYTVHIYHSKIIEH